MAVRVDIFRLTPNTYIHVLDTNTNVTHLITGPATFTRQRHQKITKNVTKMTVIPPNHYVVINSPAIYRDGKPVVDKFGQVKNRRGDEEIRTRETFRVPFPLCPGEQLKGAVSPLEIVAKDNALRLRADRQVPGKNVGDEWHFHGPGMYVPQVGVTRMSRVSALIIAQDSALLVRAENDCVDHKGNGRRTGEQWLIRTPGAYIPSVNETVVSTIKAQIITARTALHMRAKRSYTDVYGIPRKAGDEWLITNQLSALHITDVDEELVGPVQLTVLTNRQFCVITNPYLDGQQRLGSEVLRKGATCFFLSPGESLRDGIQDVHILSDRTALLLRTNEAFLDHTPHHLLKLAEGQNGPVQRAPGDLWMVYGPCEYIPSVEVEVVERRMSRSLSSTDGIYVRNNQSGQVRTVSGRQYMLAPQETLWSKELPMEVEMCVATQHTAGGDGYIVHKRTRPVQIPRDKTRLVTFRMPSNTVSQIYDYKRKKSRVVFGPNLMKLDPEEQFTVIHLSGGKPKKANAITSIALNLGPDFMSDRIVVETSDHARLRLGLCYQWHFDVGQDEQKVQEMFSIHDFIGDACKYVASRVRNTVASKSFDHFHKHSARIINAAVFGETPKPLRFKNNLVVTTVDIQSVEPVDPNTREFLQRCVTQAIQITTRSLEAKAKHLAHEEEEMAKGQLEQQNLKNSSTAEGWRKELLAYEAENAEIQSRGDATASAKARAKAAEIDAMANIQAATARAKVTEIMSHAELKQLEEERQVSLNYQQHLNELEVSKKAALAQIESSKFAKTVGAIGSDTIASIARAGPEMQAELLNGLGLKGFLVTDGSNPVNLFQTASQMITPGGAGVGMA